MAPREGGMGNGGHGRVRATTTGEYPAKMIREYVNIGGGAIAFLYEDESEFSFDGLPRTSVSIRDQRNMTSHDFMVKAHIEDVTEAYIREMAIQQALKYAADPHPRLHEEYDINKIRHGRVIIRSKTFRVGRKGELEVDESRVRLANGNTTIREFDLRKSRYQLPGGGELKAPAKSGEFDVTGFDADKASRLTASLMRGFVGEL